MDPEKVTLTVDETAKKLGMGKTITYRAIREGKIPSIRFGKRIFVPVAALDRLLEHTLSPTRTA